MTVLKTKLNFRLTVNKSLCMDEEPQALLVAEGDHPLNINPRQMSRDQLYQVHQMTSLVISRVMSLELQQSVPPPTPPFDLVVRLNALAKIVKAPGGNANNWNLVEIVTFMNRISSFLDQVELRQDLINRISNRENEYLVYSFDLLGAFTGHPMRKVDRGQASLQVSVLINTVFVLVGMLLLYCGKCAAKWKCCCCNTRCGQKEDITEI